MALSKIQSGLLDSTLDLSSNTVTLPTNVSGQLIKVYEANRTGNDTANTSTSVYAYGALTLNITPETSNDIFIVEFHSNWYQASNLDAGVRLGLYVTDDAGSTYTASTPATTNHAFWHINPLDSMRHPDITFRQTFSALSTNQHTFGYRYKAYITGGDTYPYGFQKLIVTQIVNGGSIG